MESERKSWNLSGVRWWGEVRMGNTSAVNRKRALKRAVAQKNEPYNPTECTNNDNNVVNMTDWQEGSCFQS